MKIRRLYFYLFYKMYNFWETVSIPAFWSDAKATLSIIILEEFTVTSIMMYYKIFFCQTSELLKQKWVFISMCAVLFLLNYFIFLYKKKWQQYFDEFDKLTKERNNKLGIFVSIFLMFLLANFTYACYLYLKMPY